MQTLHISQNYIIIEDEKIRIVGTVDDPYFCGKDVCAILEYRAINKALQDHVEPKYKKTLKNFEDNDPNTSIGPDNIKNLNYNSRKAVYLSKEGLVRLLLRGQTANASYVVKAISDALDLNIFRFSHFSKEQDTIGAIIQAFKHLEPQRQFNIGPYRIDLYLPSEKIAIECDEFNHVYRDSTYEREREEFIKNQLSCEFLRYNPDCKKFNVFKVIQRLAEMIDKQKTKRIELLERKLAICNLD